MTLTEHQRGLAACALAGLLWSSGGLLIKLLPYPPATINCWRSLFAMLVFAVVFGKSVLKTNLGSWLTSIFYAAMLLSFVVATKLTTSANAIFLEFTAPVYVLLLEPILFKIKLLRVNVATVCLCIVGMGLFLLDGFGSGQITGNLMALLSGACFASFMLGQRLNDPAHHAAAIFWGNFIVVAASLPTAAESGWPGWTNFSMLAFLGIFQIGGAYALFTYGLKRTLAIEASLLAFVEPILNPVWVWLGYGERPGKWAIVGGLVILTTLLLKTLVFERGLARQTEG